ncbi:hypothetical protein D3C72_2221800 [compost metagenome]
MRTEPPAGLGGDHRPCAAAGLQHLGDDALRAPVAIDVGRVDEGHAGVERGVEGRAAVRFGNLTPGATDLPRAETDVADGEVRSAE